jgi:type III pantothenate kinase
MRLLLDLGNTRLKWALQDGAAWPARGAIGWDAETSVALARALAALPPPREAFGASVVDAPREARVATCVEQAFGLEPQWLRTPAAACGVRNAYAEPARLGIDRFLAMVAAHAEGLGACVLAGVGTALTLDALTADGRHLGGLIAPGPHLMQRALLDATAQLRTTPDARVMEAADNTADAMASGCWLAATALVERFVARMTPRLGGTPVLCLGGGDAAALAGLLSLPARLAEDAVLRGLAVWAQTRSAAASDV